MAIKIYSFPKDIFEYYHNKIKEWIRAVLPTKTSDLTNDSDYLDQLALAGIIASTFSPSSTYAINDYVLYNHTLYRCKTAITSAGAWDASKWDAVKTQNIFTGSIPGLVPTATAADASKALKGDGTWGTVSTVNISYDSVAEQLWLDFQDHTNEVLIGGRWYKTVTIGNQVWLAENLDYRFEYNGSPLPVGGSGQPTTPAAWYYNNDESTWGLDGRKCGLLYNWYATKYLDDNKSTLIPGWHVPTVDEWESLITACGGSDAAGKLKASSVSWSVSWTGTDDYGFGVIPCGIRDSGGVFIADTTYDYIWSSTPNGGNSYYMEFYATASGISVYNTTPATVGATIRLVKDNT